MIRVPLLPTLLVLSAIVAPPVLAQSGKTPAGNTFTEPEALTELGTVGAWTLSRYSVAGVPTCEVVQIVGTEAGLRFSASPQEATIGFSGEGSAAIDGPIPVTILWTGSNAGGSVQSMSLDAGSGFPWRVYTAPNDEPDGLIDMFMNARSVTFGYDGGAAGPQTVTYSLEGSSRAAQAALECAMPGSFQNPVLPDAPAATAAAAPRAAGQPYVLRGTCRLVVEGRTLIDRRGDCPIWMENDGSGAFWINTDRETYLGDYFASISPFGDGTASGHWNGEIGATHAQALLGEDFRMGAGGCWIGQRATICAAR